jgi:hypothetical protein
VLLVNRAAVVWYEASGRTNRGRCSLFFSVLGDDFVLLLLKLALFHTISLLYYTIVANQTICLHIDILEKNCVF